MTTSEEPVVDKCPNCGAPMKLNAAGDCVWCHAHVRLEAPVPSDDPDELRRDIAALDNLLEGEPGELMLLQPVSNLLVFLTSTGQQPAVHDFLGQWHLRDRVRPLLAAVRATGERVTAAAMAAPDFNEYGDHSALYTAEEWWMIELANDMLVMLASLPGVDEIHSLQTLNQAQQIRSGYGPHFAEANAAVGAGPEAFKSLREEIPTAPPPTQQPDHGAAPTGEISGEGSRHFWRRHWR